MVGESCEPRLRVKGLGLSSGALPVPICHSVELLSKEGPRRATERADGSGPPRPKPGPKGEISITITKAKPLHW